jgi:hypothetical protein
MQSDGNLVAHDSSDRPYWATDTSIRGTGPYTAEMQSDGNFRVYDSTNATLWATGTYPQSEYHMGCLLLWHSMLAAMTSPRKQH